MTYYNTVRDKAVPIDFEVSRRLKSFLDNGVTCATKTFEIINDVNSRTENVASDKHSLLNVDCGFTSYLKYPTNDKRDDKEKIQTVLWTQQQLRCGWTNLVTMITKLKNLNSMRWSCFIVSFCTAFWQPETLTAFKSRMQVEQLQSQG